jgi:hypothetical protein
MSIISVVCCQVKVLARSSEDSYRLWCAVVCDLKNFVNEDLAHWRCGAKNRHLKPTDINLMAHFVLHKVLSIQCPYARCGSVCAYLYNIRQSLKFWSTNFRHSVAVMSVCVPHCTGNQEAPLGSSESCRR